ncbi:MAG TPA: TIGR03862 family flavoprotein [Bradyrhizobium sp.]|nr:TIGR03862 family flavoprotein [Bradyrhizobium sp.]
MTKNAAVIGAGPAGLMAAEVLAQGGADVTMYDAVPSAGRKFLMAGRGGLNLTHSEALPEFLARYGNAKSHLAPAIEAFPPDALRAWSEQLGQQTFVGSSGRVFPQAFKASPLLRAWLRRLDAMGVKFVFRHRWTGWDGDGRLLFQTSDGERVVDARATVLALGGASWPRLGSDGGWVETLVARDVLVTPLLPSNCAFGVRWSPVFRERHAGFPLKGVALRFGGATVRGEIMLTQTGIEGGPVYALSAALREEIHEHESAVLFVALKPDMSTPELTARLNAPRGKSSLATHLRKKLNLTPAGIGLIQEAALTFDDSLMLMPMDELAINVNSVPVLLTSIAPIARAISTAGGIAFDELDADFMIHRLPGVFAAGEMLDWEAPTGGYLLQASFATGAAAGRGALKWIAR